MITGIGVDIIEIDRLKNIIDKYKDIFLRRIFTSKEIEYCNKQYFPPQHFAGKFAAKEAIAKCFGKGINGNLSFKDIEILNDEFGKPIVLIKNEISNKIKLSISHSNSYAIAFAIIEE